MSKDDWLVILAVLGMIGICILLYIVAHYGQDLGWWTLPPTSNSTG